ncbi:MAG: EamA family transporter RarD [Cryobacterium sp.]|nr:EamA family transporter RarD [Cryobacterium sp.]MBX3310669.1 EamA family transporter RarD [Cryobacterium sp.]MCB1281671.1 EamA family transporter RarD [Salinibacterium sp.]
MIRGRSAAQLGVTASIASSTVFAVVFVLSAHLDATANELFGWRTFFTVAMLVGFLTMAKRWTGIKVLLRRILDRPAIGLALLVTAAMLGTQQWLFTWAPGQGRGLQVALGYFIMPIMLALIGRIVFKERLGPWRISAVAVAAIAVTYQTVQVGGLSWETLVVALGYPIYFTVRRFAGIGGSAGLSAEMMLTLPVAILLLLLDDPTMRTLQHPDSAFSMIGFGILASIGLLLYIGASQLLPMSVFGLLSYLEPILLAVAAALVLSEPLPANELPTYITIGLALVLLAVESLVRQRPPRNQPLVG